MDVNGTRFHLLLGRADFGRRCRTVPDASGASKSLEEVFEASAAGGDAAFSWDGRRHELTLGTRVFAFAPSPGNRPVTPGDRRGAAFDVHGNVYWIAESGARILVHSSGSRRTGHFWSSLDDPRHRERGGAGLGRFAPIPSETSARPIALQGLAVTSLHYLVVGATDPRGLLVFDLFHGGEPRQLLWPADVPFAPFDIAPARNGGVLVLDRENRRLWELDRTLSVVALGDSGPSSAPAPDFGPVDGTSAPTPPCRLALNLDRSLALAAADPVAVEELSDGSVLVLDSPSAERFSRVHLYARPAGRPGLEASGEPASTGAAAALVEDSKRDAFRLLGHDFVHVRRGGEDVLYVAGRDGDQAFAFTPTIVGGRLSLHPLAEVLPMRLFGGRALVAAPGGPPHYDSQEIWVPLVPLRGARFAERGTFVVPKVDGKEPGCVWHRLVIDGNVPPACRVVVRSRASDDASELPFAAWREEPAPRPRPTGTELSWSDDVRRAGLESFELLFQHAKGRYLQLEIRLEGTGRATPRIRALRAWYPRFSYLERYLPAVYRENQESASFLDRFLANLEGSFTDIEGRIAGAQALFDLRSAPPETLDWLASWYHVALDPAWDEARRRLFLAHAPTFFEWRGTLPGLRMALRLATETCADASVFDPSARLAGGIRVLERFRTRPLPGVVFSAVSEADGLPLRATRPKWDPTLGAADLHRRWQERTKDPEAVYPVAPPESAEGRALWSAFSREELGFVPRVGADVADRWRATLQRRYPSLDHLNRAWGTSFAAWSDVSAPILLPQKAAALRDWVHFQGLVLPAQDAAHRFTVFLPQGSLGLVDREKRLDLVRRVVALEKPAHTAFAVRFYWAFFRVGEARLGEGTVVDLGSRNPELLSPFVLDRNYLGSGTLAPEHPGRTSSTCGCPPSTRGGDR